MRVRVHYWVLRLKEKMAGNGASDEDLKGYRRDLLCLAIAVDGADSEIEETSVPVRICAVPKLVEKRHTVQSPSRMETRNLGILTCPRPIRRCSNRFVEDGSRTVEEINREKGPR